jgi:hypothetical protein
MAKSGKIQHPKSSYPLKSAHFAASGTVDGVARVTGTLIDQTTKKEYQGKTLLNPQDSHSGTFWVIQFVYDLSTDHKYTLELHDQSDDSVLDRSTDISIKKPSYDGINISFPQTNETIGCTEFAPYGSTTSTGGTMQGSLSCAATAQFTQASGPPDWVLYVMSNPQTPCSCTLTVSQPDGSPVPTPQSVTFTCGAA